MVKHDAHNIGDVCSNHAGLSLGYVNKYNLFNSNK